MPTAATVTIRVPTPLRKYCDGESEIEVSAADVRTALDALATRHPSLITNIRDETGSVRRHMNVFVNKSNVRDGVGLDTVLEPGDVVTILPAVSGGRNG